MADRLSRSERIEHRRKEGKKFVSSLGEGIWLLLVAAHILGGYLNEWQASVLGWISLFCGVCMLFAAFLYFLSWLASTLLLRLEKQIQAREQEIK